MSEVEKSAVEKDSEKSKEQVEKSKEQVENDQANNAVINLAINMRTFLLTA